MSRAAVAKPAQQDFTSIKIPPYHYIHVTDKNSNCTRVELGPQVFIRQNHEYVPTGTNSVKMIILPKRNYCIVENPVIRNGAGEALQDKNGYICKIDLCEYRNYMIQYGELEIRFQEQYSVPFLLYPREILKREPQQLQVVKDSMALKIEALRNFKMNDRLM